MMAWLGSAYETSSHSLKQFIELAETGIVPHDASPAGHKDGWVLAAYNHSGAIIMQHKGHGCAIYDKTRTTLDRCITKSSPNLVLMHLRKATPGLPISIENVYPFVHKNFSFCHNGWVADYQHPCFALDESFLQFRKESNAL